MSVPDGLIHMIRNASATIERMGRLSAPSARTARRRKDVADAALSEEVNIAMARLQRAYQLGKAMREGGSRASAAKIQSLIPPSIKELIERDDRLRRVLEKARRSD